MDSYTDVSTQCCGRGRMSCGASFGNGCGSYTNPDYPDMNAFPWDSWGKQSCAFLSYPRSPGHKTGQYVVSSTEGGVLEQQYPVAMAYVPWQQWQTTYAPERGLVQGTIFPDLDLQFNYGRCGR